MAFGLFGKKPPEKMQAKPAAKPRPVPEQAQRAPPVELTPKAAPVPAAKTPPPAAEVEEEDLDLDFTDFTGIQLAEETDPLQAVAEQAAIAYANDHRDEAFAILSDVTKSTDRSPEAERLWLMLFDLCQLSGNRDGYADLEMDYARRFEKQPPTWKEAVAAAAVAAAGGPTTSFKGDLVGGNHAGFEHAVQALEKAPNLRLDLGKVKAVDPDGCQRLLDLLARARKLKREVELLGIAAVSALLEPKIAAADRNQAYWGLLLEFLQRQERQDDFENLAVDFAVSFEISPPTYEAPPKPAKPDRMTTKPVPAKRPDDAFYIEGQVLGGKIDGLDAWLKEREVAVIDLAGALRLDFTSAGALLNMIMPHWQRGVAITLRHPNHLVAALLAVVGVSAMATVVFAKR